MPLLLFLVQHQDLSLHVKVCLVDEAAVQDFHFADLLLVGINAQKGAAEIVVIKTDGHSLSFHLGAYAIDMLREFRFRGFDVPVVECDATPLCQSVIRFRGPAAAYHHGVVEKTVHVFHLCVDQTVSTSQQEDKHEDSPCHSKTGEGGA